MKLIQEIVGQLLKDLEAVIEEIETDSYDTGYNAGYTACERENGLNKRNL
jgi:hypothetical protein